MRGISVRLEMLCVLGVVMLTPPPVGADDTFARVVAPFLEQHCYSCHGPRKQASQLRLDQLTGVDPSNRNLWTMIHGKVASGEMPPKSREVPNAGEKARLLQWIEQQQQKLSIVATRRLNRRELAAALREVTGLDVDYADALPGDGKVAGFDTGVDALQEASDGVARWLQITRRAVDGIRFLEPAKGVRFSVNLRELTSTNKKMIERKEFDVRKAFDAWKQQGITSKVKGLGRTGMGLFIEPREVGNRDEVSFYFPPPADRKGILRLELVVSVLKPYEGIPNPRLWVRVGSADLAYQEITGSLDEPQRLVYEVQLDDLAIESRGVKVSLRNRVELPYAVQGFENEDKSNPKKPVPGGTGLFRPKYDRKKLAPDEQPAPQVILQSTSIEPTVVQAWPPKQWDLDIGEITDNPESASKLLELWMERAWRRPVSVEERAPFQKLYNNLRERGLSFDNALRASFQSVLLSAPFRYLASPQQPDEGKAQYAIASRLSFMLVGSPTDAELRRLASQTKLRESRVLNAQVDRLLADPRSEAFLEPFVKQWLVMDQPITLAQDDLQKQDFRFGRYLKESMREETLHYIARLVHDNRPAKELIVSNWTMMNDSLARHYGYSGIEGGHLRKVQLRPDDPRGGGILGHAGLQSMLCWMGENWVIYRGAWAARHILDHPPPPPPLEVPELDPSDGENKGKTFRELLKQHQEDSRCSVCHKNIDPIGFAFQNFDLSGRWRNVEHASYSRSELDGKIAWKGVGKTRPVDASGHLPRGEEYKSFDEFKRLVVDEYQTDVVRGLLKNFMIYATGRVPDIATMREIEAIMSAHKQQGYPLRDLLKSVVRSRAFLGRIHPDETTTLP